MKQRYADIGGGFELLQGLPALRTFGEVCLEGFLLRLGQVARGRDGAQLQESVMGSCLSPPIPVPMTCFIFHAVALLVQYSHTSASATCRVHGSSGAAHCRGAAQASD